MGPEGDNLSIAQDTFTTRSVIPLHTGAGVCSNDLLPHRPTENCPCRSQDLVGQDRRRDGSDGRLDVRSLDGADIQLGPLWQQIFGDQRLRLPPALVFLSGIFVDVAVGHLFERSPATQSEPIRVWVTTF